MVRFLEKFYSNDSSSPKILLGFKFQLNWAHCLDITLQLPITYCVSLMVTINSHIFINIFQTVHFLPVKFTRGNEKNTSFCLITNPRKFERKSDRIGSGSFKTLSGWPVFRRYGGEKLQLNFSSINYNLTACKLIPTFVVLCDLLW